MGDDVVRFQDMNRILTGHKTEEKFSMVGPLLATPLYYLGRALGELERWVWHFNRVVLLTACVGFWWLFRPILSVVERARFTVALSMVSMIPHHLMFFGGETFTCVVVSFGMAAFMIRGAWWGVPLMVAGAVNLPGTMGGLACAALVLVARTRRLRYLALPPIAFGLWLLENYLRRGDLWFTGYDGDHGVPTVLPYSGKWEFSYPLFFGLLSVLFSFGKGLIFFVPALFLPLPADPDRPAGDEDRLRWVYRGWMGFMVGVVLMYSKWWCWAGGWFWGPRFFLFGCFVAALVLARRTAGAGRASTGANLLTLLALVLSGWVALCGLVYQQSGLIRYVPDGYALEFVVWYVPECSALWWPFVTPVPFQTQDWVWLAVIVTGLGYLAGPVLAALTRQLPEYVSAGWRAVRTGPVRI